MPIYRIINIARFLAFILVIGPDSGPILTHFFGEPNFAKQIAIAMAKPPPPAASIPSLSPMTRTRAWTLSWRTKALT